MLKKGDKVVALGDGWISKGSVGVVEHIKSGSGSILVEWLEVAEGRHSKKPGTKLFHMPKNLALYGDISDPNLAFRMKNVKK